MNDFYSKIDEKFSKDDFTVESMKEFGDIFLIFSKSKYLPFKFIAKKCNEIIKLLVNEKIDRQRKIQFSKIISLKNKIDQTVSTIGKNGELHRKYEKNLSQEIGKFFYKTNSLFEYVGILHSLSDFSSILQSDPVFLDELLNMLELSIDEIVESPEALNELLKRASTTGIILIIRSICTIFNAQKSITVVIKMYKILLQKIHQLDLPLKDGDVESLYW